MKTIKINNNEYDITNYNHPGGSVIHYMTGQDATFAFEEFHYRSKKANLVLQSLPHKPVKSTENEMLTDFIQFRKSLEQRGFFKPNFLHVFYRIVELLSLAIELSDDYITNDSGFLLSGFLLSSILLYIMNIIYILLILY